MKQACIIMPLIAKALAYSRKYLSVKIKLILVTIKHTDDLSFLNLGSYTTISSSRGYSSRVYPSVNIPFGSSTESYVYVSIL